MYFIKVPVNEDNTTTSPAVREECLEMMMPLSAPFLIPASLWARVEQIVSFFLALTANCLSASVMRWKGDREGQSGQT